jgi:hypothetical protein
MRTVSFVMMVALSVQAVVAQQFGIAPPTERESKRINYHKVMYKNYKSPAPEPGAENTPLLPLLVRPDGKPITSADEWLKQRRPELVRQWLAILGKVAPTAEDAKWFGDVRQVVSRSTSEREGYTRIDLDIPMEKDFVQRHLLLLPKGQGNHFPPSFYGRRVHRTIASPSSGGARTLPAADTWY